MNKLLHLKFSAVILLLLYSFSGFGQTTITTATPAYGLSNNPGCVTFAVKNTNTYPIAITSVSGYHNSANNNSKYTVWYNTTNITGAPTINTANGWQQLGISPNISSVSGLVTLVNNTYLIIPPNTTYRFAVSISLGFFYYAISSTNTWSAGGVSIFTGNNPASAGYTGTMPSPTTTPATFSGSITFVQAAPRNVSAIKILLPANNAQFCSYQSTPIKVVIRNVGDSNETNFPITAAYTNSVGTSTFNGTYTGTIQPFTNDTVVIGSILPPSGYSYTMRAYTQLPADTVAFNDTTSAVNFIYKSPIPTPIVFNDTVCFGNSAFIGVLTTMPNTTYSWYDSLTGGSLVNISNNLSLPTLNKDTSFYVSALTDGCLSPRTKVVAKAAFPPHNFLPHDTILCLSKPMTLDAGNAGGKYLWSTGDSTQTLYIPTLPGTYWVKVTKYCTVTDTTHITIHPEPICTGISYIRMANTYYFSPSSVQNVDTYLWIFGDGSTASTDTVSHTYAYGVVHPDYDVMLLVGNACGTITLKRKVPTSIDDFNDLQTSISCYPNPASENINIASETALIKEVYLVNALGELVSKQSFNNEKSLSVSLKGFSNGLYFVKLKTNLGDLTKPIQIIK